MRGLTAIEAEVLCAAIRGQAEGKVIDFDNSFRDAHYALVKQGRVVERDGGIFQATPAGREALKLHVLISTYTP